MRIILIAAAAATLSFAAFSPASAFVANQSHVVAAKTALDDVVAVRHHHRHYKHHYKHRPPGWSRGKAWWKRGGHGVPPGHRR